jgi:hypothetical protein
VIGSLATAGNRHLARRWSIFATAGLFGLAALWFAAPWLVSLAQIATAFVVLAICVRAAVDRGRSQAFSIGFTICALAFWFIRWSQIPFFIAGFGTEGLTSSVHRHIARTIWIDTTTGQEFDYDPATRIPPGSAINAVPPADVDGDGAADFLFAGPTAAPIRYRSRRQLALDDVRPIARCLWTLLLGFAGGWFARYCYVKRAEGESR